MPAIPAAPAARHSDAFSQLTPPSANTGMRTAPAASASAATPNGAPYRAFEAV